MKTLLVFALAVFFGLQFVASEGPTHSELARKFSEKVLPYFCDCKKQTDISSATFLKWMLDGEYAKCGRLMCCIRHIYKEIGLIGENNEIVKDKFIAGMPLSPEHNEEIYNKCSQIKGKNDCNTIYLIDKCASEEIKARVP